MTNKIISSLCNKVEPCCLELGNQKINSSISQGFEVAESKRLKKYIQAKMKWAWDCKGFKIKKSEIGRLSFILI